jgi:SAM-dependent methyltransferase
VTVEIVNHEQAAHWDGEEGDGWTEGEERHNCAVRALNVRLFATAAVTAGDRVLDIGCGCGETTREAARLAPDGGALGVDLSSRMLERARERSREEGITNVTFQQADAQVHPFVPDRFDLVISRTGAMFFADPVAAFTNVAAGTKRAGRLALLVWQDVRRNEWVLALREALAMGRDLPVPAAGVPGPFALSDADAAGAMLRAAGWERIEFEDVQAPFHFGDDADDAYSFVRGLGIVRGLLHDLDPDAAARGMDDLRAALAARETGDGVAFDSRSWIITGQRA